MNCVDYFLSEQIKNEELFILGRSEEVSFIDLAQSVTKLSVWLKK